MPLPCQEAMLHTRQDFPDGWRVYRCPTERVACVVSGAEPDEMVLVETCRRLCSQKIKNHHQPAEAGQWGAPAGKLTSGARIKEGYHNLEGRGQR